MTNATRSLRSRKAPQGENSDTPIIGKIETSITPAITRCSTVNEDVVLMPFDPPEEFDGLNPEHMRSIIQDLEAEIKIRNDAVVDARERAMDFLRQESRLLMFKIPKLTKSTTVAEFRERFGVDMRQMTVVTGEGALKRAKLGINTSTTNFVVHQTPLRPIRSAQLTSTVQRTVRRGERLFSQNGSPVIEDQDVDGVSIKATIGKRFRDSKIDQPDVGLHLGNGNYVNMVPENIAGLDEELKSVVWKQLKALQQSLSTIEECFQNN